MKWFFERLRSRRLASTFVLLATLSVAIVGRILCRPRGTRTGKAERQLGRHSAQSRELGDSTPMILCGLPKQVGPAVVNINTQTLPKQSENKRAPQFPFPDAAQPAESGRQRRSEQRSAGTGQLPGLFQPLLWRPGSREDPMRAKTAAKCRNRSARDSSSIPRDTLSPTST